MDLRGIDIHDNQFTNLRSYGISFAHFSGSTLLPPTVQDILVHSNSVEMKAGIDGTTALFMYNGTGPGETLFDNFQVYDNDFIGDTAVIVGYENFILSGNRVDVDDAAKNSNGMDILFSSNFSIESNTVEDAGNME